MPRALASSQGHHHAIGQDPNRQNIPPNGGSPYCLFSQSVSFVLSFITDASSHTESPTNPLHTTPPDSIPFHHPHHAPHTTHHAPHTTHHSPITRHRTQNTTHHTPPSPPPTPITRLHTPHATHHTPHTTPPCTARHTPQSPRVWWRDVGLPPPNFEERDRRPGVVRDRRPGVARMPGLATWRWVLDQIRVRREAWQRFSPPD